METDQYTLKEEMIDVGDGHSLYAQLWGNPDAVETIVFLHGGPGSGCSNKHKSLFDPSQHRVIFFDQRGCGKSTPRGLLVANDTEHMIEDINQVAAVFATDKFAITGGSWGSCLALAYGLKYPERVTRMVLRGIFTGRKSEIDFIDKGGLRSFFPEIWDEFVDSVPAEHQNDPGAYHLKRVLGDDPEAAKHSAYAYSRLEDSAISLDDRRSPEPYETFDPISSIVECHYLANACFLPEGYIIENATKLTMPIRLVQGRYDAVCPPFTAYELSKILPDGQLFWTVAGHSGNDRANWDLTKALLAQIPS
jgi:proline iminopeptidase